MGAARISLALLLCCSLALFNQVAPKTLLEGPLNTAEITGQRVSLNCSSSSVFIAWYFTAVYGDTEIQTVYDGTAFNPKFDGIYNVLLYPGGYTNLIILNATINQTGVYRCKEYIGFEPHATANFVHLLDGPQCSINATNIDPDTGEVIAMTCSSYYTNNVSPLMMNWTDPWGMEVESETQRHQVDDYLMHMVSTIMVTAAPPNIGPHQCHIYFSEPENLPSTAKNAPTYTYTYQTPMVVVKYCPNTVTIDKVGEIPVVGQNLICTSNGNPAPMYRWTHMQSGLQTDGRVLMLTRSGFGTYKCEAYNPDQEDCSASTTTNFTVIADSCMDLKRANNNAPSGKHTLTLKNGKSFEAYCEMGLNGGGYTFLSPQSMLDLTDDDIQTIFTDRTNVLMKIRKFDGTQPYLVIKQITQHSDIPLMLGLSQNEGYEDTQNAMDFRLDKPYLYVGFLSSNLTSDPSITQWGLNVNGQNLAYPKWELNLPRNHLAVFPGFLESGYWNSGSTNFTLCNEIFVYYPVVTPSSRIIPTEYFMGLEAFWQGNCQTASNSINFLNLNVANAAIGFR